MSRQSQVTGSRLALAGSLLIWFHIQITRDCAMPTHLITPLKFCCNTHTLTNLSAKLLRHDRSRYGSKSERRRSLPVAGFALEFFVMKLFFSFLPLLGCYNGSNLSGPMGGTVFSTFPRGKRKRTPQPPPRNVTARFALWLCICLWSGNYRVSQRAAAHAR